MRRYDIDSEPPVFACRFCTKPGYEEVLGLANEDGRIALQDTKVKGRNNEPLEGVQAHANAIFDIAWMPGELKLVTVAGDHTARLWDVSTFGRSDIKELGCFRAHTRSVKTVAFRYQDKAVFATGARDGVIMIWDVRANHLSQPRPDNSITYGHPVGNTAKKRRKLLQPSRSQSITGLTFQDDFTLISCAAGDGFIKIWDLRKNYTVHKKEPIAKHQIKYTGNSSRNGFSSLSLCPARITLYASCMDHVIYSYNVSSHSHELLATYYGHQNHTYYVKTCLSADGRYLASGSSDNLAYIWRVNKPGKPLIRLSGHREEVTCIAWCNVGDTKIVTCSDDSYHRIWKVGYEHKTENEEIEVRGRAQLVTDENVYMGGIRTPSTTTRLCDRTPGSDNGSPAIPGPSNDEHDAGHCVEHPNTPIANTLKRSYSQMVARARSEGKLNLVLSPIGENSDEAAAKRMRTECRSARRLLFSTGDKSASGSSKNHDSDESHASESASVSDRNVETLCSPTVNLPNFVIDGTAPHLLQISPQKQKENVDWLTKIRKERYEQKVGKFTLGKPSSPKGQTTPARRTTRSRSHDPQKASKTTVFSLLDFFKALNSDCEKNPPTADNKSADVPSTSNTVNTE
ncbi:protein lethal(2)denticleless isoform X2 [Harpegnathos saltator]|uniref:Protein lethal(2)denticleless n=2 Tax=Harpegnathos saltator TaxID=610380 RepID=E2C530_HARSA|nr:protein lethal(2)denticleless isoform X2 [Harpegnathos saltator]EFN76938.1 Protein lethal(2)denticleless [Harpegnathos saltator]